MNQEEKGKRKKTFSKSSIIKILIFTFLAVDILLGLYPLQIRIRDRIGRIRDNFIFQAEEFLGRKVQYGSIGPSIFGVLDIRDVRIVREDDSIFLSISRLRLSYSIVKLIRGDLQNVFKSIRIDKPVLNLDFQKDADLLERFSSLRVEGTEPDKKNTVDFKELLPENFSIRILNGEWELSAPVGTVKLHGAGLDASVRKNRISFKGRWNALFSPVEGIMSFLPPSTSMAFQAAMTGRISGDYSGDKKEGSASLSIPSVSGNFFRAKPLGLNLFFSGNKLELRKTHDKSPAAFSLVYDFDRDNLQGRFDGKNFPLQDFLSFSGDLKDYNPVLSSRISGTASFEKEGSEKLWFSVDLSGSGPRNFQTNLFLERAFLDIKATGNKDSVRIENFEISSPNGSIGFRGGVDFTQASQFAPYGLLSLSNFRLRGKNGISGDIFISSVEQEISFFSESITAGNTKLSSLDLSFNRGRQGLDFVFSALSFKKTATGDSRESARRGSISIAGSADNNPRQFRANLTLDSFAASDILNFVEPLAPAAIPSQVRSLASDLSLSTEVFFFTDYKNVLFNTPRIVAAYEGMLDILIAASLSGTDRGIELDASRISWGTRTMEMTGSVDFSDPGDITFYIGASFQKLTYFFEGLIRNKRGIAIRGSYGFQLFLAEEETGMYSGYSRGDMLPFPSGEKFASFSFLSTLSYGSPSFWHAALEKFELLGVTTPVSSNASLRLSAEANEKGLTIPDIVFDDGRGALTGGISFDWDSTYKFAGFNAEINSGNSNEYYDLNGMYKDNHLDLFFSGQWILLFRFSARNALVDGSFRLSWDSPESFDAEITIPSFVLYNQSKALRVSANVKINNDEFLAEKLKLNYSDLEVLVPFVRIDRTVSRAETEMQIWGLFLKRPVDISVRGDAAFNSSATWVDLVRDFGSFDGSLTVNSAIYNTMEAEEPFAFLFNCQKENGSFALDLNGGPRNMLRFRYTPELAEGGLIYAALSAPSPVRGTISGFIDSEKIDAQGTNLYADLGSLWRFVPPVDNIAFPAGIVTASIRVTGSPEEPEFYGSALGTSLQILVPRYLPEPIKPVPITVLLNGNEMTFGPVNAFVGQGGGIVSGWFRFEQWIPNIFSIDILVPPEYPIPYDFDISGVLAKGMVSGDLVLSMENMVFSITGELTAHDTEISLNSNELATSEGLMSQDKENSTVSIVSNVSIKTGRRVEFFWPSADFPVVQATADFGTGVHITSDDMARRYTFTGDVKLRSGEIFYLERNFYIREGTLFFRENETQFDPRISARAEIRDQAEIGPVTISMIIDNAPLRSFTPRFISTPALSQLEIYSILGQSPQLGGEQQNIALSAAIDSLAQFTVVRRLQRQIRDFVGLDMLSMRTQLLQNVVLQATGGQQSSNNPEKPYRVGNYFDNTTVFLGKYIGADLFGEAMLSFKYDENKQSLGGLVVEPELGLEMRNPLFDIRFNMVPLHPENMFINDISISLIWRRSF
jgi:hypothetical protein